MPNPPSSTGATPEAARALTGGRRLARNSLLNLAGGLVPLGLAIFAVPPLVATLGTDRFGLLTLAWVVIGYFGFLDLGLGWALTKLVADRLGADRSDQVPALARTALAVAAVLGVAGAVGLAGAVPALVGRVLDVPPELRAEGRRAFLVLAASIPFVVVTAGLRGVVAAHQRFDLVTLVRIPMGVWTFLGPLLVALGGGDLAAIVAALAVGRLVAMLAYLRIVSSLVPGLLGPPALDRAWLRPLFGFGGWMTVSNVVGPLLVSADRFLIGAWLSVGAVTFYATPQEVVSRLLIVPGALIGVLFPAIAATASRDPARAAALLGRGMAAVLLLLYPVVVVLAAIAPEGLEIWLGPEFAVRSAPVLRWLAAGVLVNGLGQVAWATVQGAGRPDITARLHLAELAVYLPTLLVLVRARGIEGAAIAWLGRAALDAVLLAVFATRLLPPAVRRMRRIGIVLLAGLGGVLAVSVVPPVGVRLVASAALAIGVGLAAWRGLLDATDRRGLVDLVRRRVTTAE